MHAAKNWEMVKILRDNMNLRTYERDSIMGLLNSHRVNYQIWILTSRYLKLHGDICVPWPTDERIQQECREIQRLYDNLLNKGAEAYILESRFNKLTKSIDSLKFLYDINISEAQKMITYSHIVENPLVPDKKAYPVRWIIVAFSLMSALFVALLAFVVLDFKK
jgi:hypothetical protein